MASLRLPDFGHVPNHELRGAFNEPINVDGRAMLAGPKRWTQRSGELIVRLDKSGSRNCSGIIANGHADSLSVGGVGSPTVATGGEATSLPAASAPALCTICDHRLDDTTIRACSLTDCPNAQKEAA